MSVRSLRERRKQETREQIQRAARRLMARSGYERVTMRALAEAAGVGLGTIALHFRDKQSLLLSTFYEEIERESLEALAAAPREGSLKDKLMNVAAALYGYYAENTVFLRPVFREALFATGEWRKQFDVQHAALLAQVAGVIEAHKASGEVRPDVSSEAVALAGWGLYLSVLVDGLNAETFDVKTLLDRLEPMFDVLLKGALAQGGDHARL